jgi:hypothetical protein
MARARIAVEVMTTGSSKKEAISQIKQLEAFHFLK